MVRARAFRRALAVTAVAGGVGACGSAEPSKAGNLADGAGRAGAGALPAGAGGVSAGSSGASTSGGGPTSSGGSSGSAGSSASHGGSGSASSGGSAGKPSDANAGRGAGGTGNGTAGNGGSNGGQASSGGAAPVAGAAGAKPNDPACPATYADAWPPVVEFGPSPCTTPGLSCGYPVNCNGGQHRTIQLTCEDATWGPTGCDHPYDFCLDATAGAGDTNPTASCEDGSWLVANSVWTVYCPAEAPADGSACDAVGGTESGGDRDHCGYPCSDPAKWTVVSCIKSGAQKGTWSADGACN
jgi:hypothetical protein